MGTRWKWSRGRRPAIHGRAESSRDRHHPSRRRAELWGNAPLGEGGGGKGGTKRRAWAPKGPYEQEGWWEYVVRHFPNRGLQFLINTTSKASWTRWHTLSQNCSTLLLFFRNADDHTIAGLITIEARLGKPLLLLPPSPMHRKRLLQQSIDGSNVETGREKQ